MDKDSAKRSPTASTTSRPTPAGCRWAPTTTLRVRRGTLRRWWDTIGRRRYPHADRLLICADGGGSNGYRVRAWKVELAALAAQTGLAITVYHLPRAPAMEKSNTGCSPRSP